MAGLQGGDPLLQFGDLEVAPVLLQDTAQGRGLARQEDAVGQLPSDFCDRLQAVSRASDLRQFDAGYGVLPGRGRDPFQTQPQGRRVALQGEFYCLSGEGLLLLAPVS